MYLKTLFIFTLFVNVYCYELKQVIVLSRHNLRTPWSPDIELMTPKKLPNWTGDPGDLTPKGRRLEIAMGKYFKDWMIQEKLLDNNCPRNKVFVHANNIQRTIETAKSFVKGAFGDCVNVYYQNSTNWDPVFELVMRNCSTEFKETAMYEMRKKLKSYDLEKPFLLLNKIADFENSPYCNINEVCDLNEAKSEVSLEVNDLPGVSGPIRIGSALVDAFLMAYYEGKASDDVAWGQIDTMQQWAQLIRILEAFNELRFETNILNKDIATILIKYLTDIFQHGDKKLYLLVGHDANISLLKSTLKFKDYILSKQFENKPIGGKVVFQKWYDSKNDRYLLKVNYVYQSSAEIRDGAEVSLENPPEWHTLEVENCNVDENGFCVWNDFISILNRLQRI